VKAVTLSERHGLIDSDTPVTPVRHLERQLAFIAPAFDCGRMYREQSRRFGTRENHAAPGTVVKSLCDRFIVLVCQKKTI
jgi:hypothetical protein